MDRETGKIAKLLHRVERDVDASAQLLSIAADYLKTRRTLPDDLADYLASAFRYASNAVEADTGQTAERVRVDRLAHALGMTRNEGRPKAHVPAFDVTMTVAQFGDQLSETELAKRLAETYGVSLTTARTHIRTAKAKIAEWQALGGNELRQQST